MSYHDMIRELTAAPGRGVTDTHLWLASKVDAKRRRAFGRDAEEREKMGRVVREAWIRWAMTQPNPKPSWLVPWEEMSEADREADRQIGMAVVLAWEAP